MRLLVLGGTKFFGRHVIEMARARGIEVTMFNRGLTAPGLYPDVEHLVGDRAGDLSALRGRTWEAVVDTCSFIPAHTRASTRMLAGAVGHYTMVSTMSVYSEFATPDSDETLATYPADYESTEVTGPNYGPLKVACEEEAERAMPGRVLVPRPGFIVGPFDDVPRLPYWMRRVARGGEVLAPGGPDRLVQIIDVRDIVGWILDMAARGGTGIFNVTGPVGALTMGDMLETIRRVTGSDARFVWADDALLQEHGVAGVDGLPYWLPKEAEGAMRTSIAKAQAAGFTCRPFDDTARDTWAWLGKLPDERPPHSRTRGKLTIASGIAPEDEARLLERARATTGR